MHTYVRFNNAGRTKIYDDAMAWIIFGFLTWPFYALAYTLYYWVKSRGEYGFFELAGLVFKTMWRHQRNVWNSL